jgi:hypothetical protein
MRCERALRGSGRRDGISRRAKGREGGVTLRIDELTPVSVERRRQDFRVFC